MNLRSPISDLLPGARGQVLSVLAQVGRPLTVRALAQHAGVSPQTALDTVNDLADVGLVRADRAGQALMVSLNRDHLLVEPLSGMVETRGRLVIRLSEHLATWKHLAGAWLFGSAARGDGDRRSDIDVLAVADSSTGTEDWIEATSELHGLVERWSGNPLQLVEHTRASFGELVRGDNPLVDSIRQDGIPLKAASRSLLRPS